MNWGRSGGENVNELGEEWRRECKLTVDEWGRETERAE